MSNEQADLRGQVALITGASSGIGAAMAKTLAQHGVKVALSARRAEKLAQVAQAIQQAGGDVFTVTADVRDEASVKQMVQATVDHFGGLDILIPNAGLGYRSSIVEGDPARWKLMLDTNVYGVLLTLKYGVPHVVARGQGDVFLLSSVAGKVVGNGGAGYSATKFAVNAIGEALRQEVTRQNVRVTLLAPGVVVSEFQAVADYPPGLIERWLDGKPPLEAQDIADAVLAVLRLPRHMAINEMVIRPTGQATP